MTAPRDPNAPRASTRTQTFGQRAVGLDFNPSGDPKVTECKQAFAGIIDMLHRLRENATGASAGARSERARLASVAITEAQTAQMWAVKALTWREDDASS
jgi:hypothetical protein